MAAIRPELMPTSVEKRKEIRSTSIADQAVVFHGYAKLANSLLNQLLKSKDQEQTWLSFSNKLQALSPSTEYIYDGWKGDIFDRANPIWQAKGILAPTKSGKLSVKNTRDTREWVSTILSHALNGQSPP